MTDNNKQSAKARSGPTTLSPNVSVIVPVYNGGDQFEDCLAAIARWKPTNWELIVVDDGSTDQSAALARHYGATVMSTEGRLGPGAARNIGSRYASGEYVCFIDADCEVNAVTFKNMAGILSRDTTIDALFGSYDTTPRAPSFLSQYKNLMHHWVHQNSSEDAATFWSGCGVVRRSLFLALGGFDVVTYKRPSIEDIDLGYRIKQAGGKIVLSKKVQVKHYKNWTLMCLLKTDVFDRGIPWTRLILSDKSRLINDLNLGNDQRLSLVVTYLLLLSLALIPFVPHAGYAAAALAVVLFSLNINTYGFFVKRRGALFAIPAIGMHWLYFVYCGIAFWCGVALHTRDKIQGKEVLPVMPIEDAAGQHKNTSTSAAGSTNSLKNAATEPVSSKTPDSQTNAASQAAIANT
ncbi:MAG: glycosyltransferase family A protein [Candidatus Obscuribacterales bacterium]